MLSVQEARQQILSHFRAIETEAIPLAEARTRVLAEDIHAADSLPPFDNSSVDGFALRSEDVASAKSAAGIRLPVVGDIPAGSTPDFRLQSGQAARIMTGAPLPSGADAVVMVEGTDFGTRDAGTPAPAEVTVFVTVKAGEHVRQAGTDLHAGDRVLNTGRRLRPQDIGMLATLGVAKLSVYRMPSVAILSSGDELLPVDAPLTPGKVRDANSYSLAALAEEAGCRVLPLGVARDTRQSVEERLEKAVSARADVILSSAGVSVGAFDYVKDVVTSQGALDFWKVNMRPGKPLAFGHYHQIPFFGLPGNPVSAFVGFEVFVRPALGRLCGVETVERPRVRVTLGEAVESDGRESYLRAQVNLEDGKHVAHLTGHQGSGNLFSLVQANALLIIPSGVKSCPPYTEVEAWLMED